MFYQRQGYQKKLQQSKDLKKQTDIVEKQNRGFNNIYEFVKKEGDKTINKEKNIIHKSND